MLKVFEDHPVAGMVVGITGWVVGLTVCLMGGYLYENCRLNR